MEGIIQGNCLSATPNVGASGCATFEKQPKGVIITAENFAILPNEDFSTQLNMAVKDYAQTNAWPLLDGLVNLEPSGGDSRISQEGFGETSINGRNPYSETWTYTKGGICMFKQIEKLDNAVVRVFWVDEDNNVYGTVNSDGKYVGFKAVVGVDYRKNVGTAVAANKVLIHYSNSYSAEFKNIMSQPLTLELSGMRMLQIQSVTRTEDASVFKCKLALECSGYNMTAQMDGRLDPVTIKFWADNQWNEANMLSFGDDEWLYVGIDSSGYNAEDMEYVAFQTQYFTAIAESYLANIHVYPSTDKVKVVL